jgi:hypothetical protein
LSANVRRIVTYHTAVIIRFLDGDPQKAYNDFSPAGVLPGLSPDEGIARIAAKIEAGLPEERRIAVVNLESPSARFSDLQLNPNHAGARNNLEVLWRQGH